MLSRLSLMDLTGIAGVVTFFGAGISVLLVNKARDKVTKQDYYRNAFKVLDSNKAAIDLIGRPIKRYRVDLSDSKNNSFEGLSARLKVPFKGTNKSGDLYVWADRQDVQNEWTLRRLEIIFDDIRDKKVIVYKKDLIDE